MGSEEVFHGPRRLLVHVFENVGVAPQGHCQVGVPQHLRDRRYGEALLYRQRRCGVAEVMEANLGGEPGLREQAAQGANTGRAP